MPLKLVPPGKRSSSGCWYIRGTVRGIRVEESTGTADRRLAEEFRSRREAELFTEALYGRAVSKSFAQAALSYIEAGGSRRFLEKPLDRLGLMALGAIGYDEIHTESLVCYPNASPATRNRQFFTPTCAVLKHAAECGWCAMPVMKRPKQPKAPPRWLDPEEAEKLIAACGASLRPLVVFMLYTGARAGEALWLDWRNVDLVRAHVVFPKTKNGDARGVPLHPRVVAELANLNHRDGCVFRKPSGEEYTRPVREDDTSAGARIKTAFKAAQRRAGIKPLRVHDCRHTWATWHYIANRDLVALMRLGGWKSEKMVLRYAHVNVGELSHTIDRLPGGITGEMRQPMEKTA